MKTKSNPLVTVITVNFNSTQVTLELLQSLRHSTYSPIEIIVIDNGSTENPETIIHTQFPEILFKRSSDNLGFAGGNNLGISMAKGDYLFFINNDTEVTPNLISNLATTLSNNDKIGVVSPKIKFFNTNIIQYAGYTPMSLIARNEAIGSKQHDTNHYTGLHPTPYAHGAAMMVRKSVIEKTGPMPEDFFLYYEELDWCERIRREGFTIMVDLDSLIYHKESMSVGKASPLKLFYQTRNRILFVRRNMPTLNKILFHLYFYAAVSPVKLFLYTIKGQKNYARTYWSALCMVKKYQA
jgi:GT2 family glycosyltransferase